MATELFWLAAVLEVLASAAFALRWHRRATPHVEPRLRRLGRGQRLDDGLACIAAIVVALDQGGQAGPVLPLAATMLLAWLTRRTVQRLKSLPG